MSKRGPIVIDGRTLEGGGQLLRNSICLSALTRTPVKITHIRGNRSGGSGLKAQHLACVNWLALASRARTTGAHRGSTELEFSPSTEKPSHHLSPAFRLTRLTDGQRVYTTELAIGTAGSTTLALQAILPFILFNARPEPLPIHLTLSGGTNVSNSPSFEYVEQVLLPILRALGLPSITANLKKRGLNCIGKIEFIIPAMTTWPLPARSLCTDVDNLAQRPPPSLHATFVGQEEFHEEFRQLVAVSLAKHFPGSSSSIICYAVSKGSYVLLTATSTPSLTAREPYVLAADLLGAGTHRKDKRGGKSAVEILAEAVDAICADLARQWATGAVVDAHMRDQIVVYRALAQGSSAVAVGVNSAGAICKPSLHAKTAEWVATTITGAEFDRDGTCRGCSFTPNS